ncbi:MAG: SdrD B-like domain-containing protein, partial [Pseudomonadota bacterium]|nr:SdrD B-like domain-containing protein [Pseudomonadota bacterium]
MSLPPVFTIKATYTLTGATIDAGLIPSFLDIEFLGASPFGIDAYNAWCIDRDANLDVTDTGLGYYTGTLQASVYSINESTGSFDAIFPNPQTWGNLDELDWLLRQDFSTNGYTFGEVQAAAWTLMGDDWSTSTSIGTPDPAKVTALVDLAHANNGYTPVFGVEDVLDSQGNIVGCAATGDISVVLATFIDVNGNGVKDVGDIAQQPIIIRVKSAALGDSVWEDSNGNGIQDAGEVGIAGAIVHLVRDANNDGDFLDAGEILQTTTTDANGNYLFTGLAPGAAYQVQFFTPAGYDGSSPRQADGSATSGANSDGQVSDVIVLAAGECNKTVDSGFYKNVSVGNSVWNDINNDGIQNDGATGLGGVALTLTGTTGSGLPVLLTTTTAADGSYLFANLAPGTYQVSVDASNFVSGGALDGYVASPAGQGLDPALDSNASPTGTTPVLLTSGNDDLTLDF